METLVFELAQSNHGRVLRHQAVHVPHYPRHLAVPAVALAAVPAAAAAVTKQAADAQAVHLWRLHLWRYQAAVEAMVLELAQCAHGAMLKLQAVCMCVGELGG